MRPKKVSIQDMIAEIQDRFKISDEEALYIKEVTEEKTKDPVIQATVKAHRDDRVYLEGPYQGQVNGQIQAAPEAGRGETLSEGRRSKGLEKSGVRRRRPHSVDRGRKIASRLLGRAVAGSASTPAVTEEEFTSREFKNVSIDKLGLDAAISTVLKQRLDEIRKCLTAKAPLAVIFLCGSTLEGILLGIASAKAKDFNQPAISPKDKQGNVKQFYDWTLYEFINVARDLGLLGEDVKKFSHALRDFRNYIHPYQQMSQKFDPDEHTARICWQVLQAAITQLSK